MQALIWNRGPVQIVDMEGIQWTVSESSPGQRMLVSGDEEALSLLCQEPDVHFFQPVLVRRQSRAPGQGWQRFEADRPLPDPIWYRPLCEPWVRPQPFD